MAEFGLNRTHSAGLKKIKTVIYAQICYLE